MSTPPLFNRIAIVGIGLIGSSVALAARHAKLAKHIVCADSNPQHVAMALELELVEDATTDLAHAVEDADLVMLATPVRSFAAIAEAMAPHLAPGCIVTDVGSVKEAPGRAVAAFLPPGVAFVPGHPIAGTEFSGPEAGFKELFQDRWCLLTPDATQKSEAIAKIQALWEGMGSRVEVMSPAEHDRILGTTSHVPHVMAFSLIGLAEKLGHDMGRDVMMLSAGTFRDMTRVAASDPTMWRDIFLTNRDAVLEISQRLIQEIEHLRALITSQDAEALHAHLAHIRHQKTDLTERQKRMAEKK